jgi:hypothetical protein
MKSKRGSIIAESALVLPFVILTVFFLLSLAFRFYDGVLAQTKQYSDERAAAQTEGLTNFNEAKFAKDLDFLVEGLSDAEGKE